jgi:hypothetical protein
MLSLFSHKLYKNKYFLSFLKVLAYKRLCLRLIFLPKPVVTRIKIGFYTLITKKGGGSKAVVNTLIFKKLKLNCVTRVASC